MVEEPTRGSPAQDGPADEAGAERREPAMPTVALNAAEQDPDPSATTSDPTAPQASADYDNDREEMPGAGDGP
ncbi:hypothetical protein [Pseudokineococcus sp. 1T1Z-3]|uniref:hypothetical protein n=1 Tax=Pseudokineococcus sp. 1T1Z-3 TaxID=3132745 RepID=UPI0030ACC9E7